MTTDYTDVASLRSWASSDITDNDQILAGCITTASRDIDAACRRRFYKDTNASARVYWPNDPWCCDVDDISSTSSLVVAIDTGSDGLYETTLTRNTDFVLEPANRVNSGIEGWPYTELRAVVAGAFPIIARAGGRQTVQVTAKWGWEAVPDTIVQASLVHANWLFAQRNTPFGAAQIGDFAVRLRQSSAATLLGPYVKVTNAGIGAK